MKNFATANHAANDKEHVVGGISITSDDVVAMEMTGPKLERRQGPFWDCILTDRCREIYRGFYAPKNFGFIWCNDRVVSKSILAISPSQGALKDYEFSRSTMEARWQQGISDARTILHASPWLAPMPKDLGVRVFDVMHVGNPKSATGACNVAHRAVK